MENTLQKFVESIFTFVLSRQTSAKGLLVKKHSENLLKHGEFSFPNTLKSWHEFILSNQILDCKNTSLLKYIGKDVENLVEESKQWSLEVREAREIKDRIHLFLERPRCIHVGLAEALINISYLQKEIHKRTSNVVIDEHCDDINSVTHFRVKCLANVVQNLCSVTQNIIDDTEIVVTSKSSNVYDRKVVLCGKVLNIKSGSKETSLSADDYLRIRKNEMELIAQHKYGVRMSTDSYNWKESMEHLGESVAIFELLQTKPSCSAKVNFDCISAGSSKGAAFILYNCARLEHIIMNFMRDGSYPLLPKLENIDFTLLTEEDEWCLIFNYIMYLPTLLKTCVDLGKNTCEFRPHNICNFLSSLVLVFSRYYRRIRILMMPRQHLLPVIFVRIHMLMILNDIIKICLEILNIKTVLRM